MIGPYVLIEGSVRISSGTEIQGHAVITGSVVASGLVAGGAVTGAAGSTALGSPASVAELVIGLTPFARASFPQRLG